jgi:ABC-type uncharacterized transport system permease subunit
VSDLDHEELDEEPVSGISHRPHRLPVVDKYGDTGTPGNVPDYGIPDIHLHFLQNWTLIGPIFGQLNLMIWLSFALLVATCVFLFRMPSGLRFRYIAGTLFQALPYLLTLIAVGGLVGRSIGPAAAGRPYAKQ